MALMYSENERIFIDILYVQYVYMMKAKFIHETQTQSLVGDDVI
jgi:hypothetical protein